MMEGLTMATLEQANLGLVRDSGESIALGALVLAGGVTPPERAAEVVEQARSWLRDHAGDRPRE